MARKKSKSLPKKKKTLGWPASRSLKCCRSRSNGWLEMRKRGPKKLLKPFSKHFMRELWQLRKPRKKPSVTMISILRILLRGRMRGMKSWECGRRIWFSANKFIPLNCWQIRKNCKPYTWKRITSCSRCSCSHLINHRNAGQTFRMMSMAKSLNLDRFW